MLQGDRSGHQGGDPLEGEGGRLTEGAGVEEGSVAVVPGLLQDVAAGHLPGVAEGDPGLVGKVQFFSFF